MKTKLINHLPIKSLHILFLKAKIIYSVTHASFKEFCTQIFQYNPLTVSVLTFPFLFYFSLIHNSLGINGNPLSTLKLLGESNVPKLNYASTNISWETVQKTDFIGLFSKSNFLKNSLESFQVWPNRLNITFHPIWKSRKSQNFFGTQKVLPSKPEDMSLNSKVFVFPARDSFSQLPNRLNSNYHCDEFPARIKSLSPIKQNSYDLPTCGCSFEASSNFGSSDKVGQIFSQPPFTLSEPLLIGMKQELTDKNSIAPTSQNSNYNAWKQVSLKANNLFVEKNIYKSTGGDFNVSTYSFDSKIKRCSANQGVRLIEMALTSRSQNKVPLNSKSPVKLKKISSSKKTLFSRLEQRKMSGFMYPDSKTSDVRNISRSSNITFQMPASMNFASFYKPNKTEPIPLQMKYEEHTLGLYLYDEIYYAGPGVPRNSKTGLTVNNERQLRRNLERILDSADPRQNLNKSFFGVSDKYAISSPKKRLPSEYSSNKFVDLKDRPIETEDRIRAQIKDLGLNKQQRLELPKVSTKEWLKQTNDCSKVNGKSLVYYLTVRKVSEFQSNPIQKLWDSLDYQNQEWVFGELDPRFETKKFQVGLYSPQKTQSLISSDESPGTFFKAQTQKRPTNYLDDRFKNLPEWFNDPQKVRLSWEWVHLNSWLIIYQYCFALLIIYVCKEFTLQYARELGEYLVDIVSSLGIMDESLKEELSLDSSRPSGGRVLKTTNKKFSDIAGIESIFSELSEIVWFLRNKSLVNGVGNMVPRGVLLVGSPGTGKTLLVQALGGEAQVPIFVQSASGLQSLEGLGAQRLQDLFEKAKQAAPSIIFFDEIDSIGSKRSNVLQIEIGNTALQNARTTLPGLFRSKVPKEPIVPREQNHEQLSVLMQLLIELDGCQARRPVVVIGATNRPKTLDPALTRPGRFDKVFTLGVPCKTKRVEICKLYSRNLGYSPTISWPYIAQRTTGLSGADLAAIMNQSTIQAILAGTSHTIETIEYGIEKITTYSGELETQVKPATQPRGVARLAYYNSGLAMIQTMLKAPKAAIYCSLWHTKKSYRTKELIDPVLINPNTKFYKYQLEKQLCTLLSGHVSESLFFRSFSSLWDSNLGVDELKKASYLAFLMVEKWKFYKPTTDPLEDYQPTRNFSEIDDESILDFFGQTVKKMTSHVDPLSKEYSKFRNFQRWATKPWWQVHVVAACKDTEKQPSAHWYRLHTHNPVESEVNEEWRPPDCYYHVNSPHFLTKTFYFTDANRYIRDIWYQALLSNIFEMTWSTCLSNSEFLDFFVDSLIHDQMLREYDIKALFEQFFQKNKENLTI